jgi:hypothetical protein
MKIEIDRYSSDALDELFNAILIEDWRNVKDECKRLKSSLKKKIPEDHPYYNNVKEDLKNSKKTKKAYETIIRYCLSYDRATELLGEETVKEKKSV